MKLRNLCDKDIPFMMEWMLDKDINRFFRFDSSKITYDSIKTFIDEANISNNCVHKAVVNSNDEYYGTVSLKNINYVERMAEYAISTRKIAKHKGYGQFATNEILRIAFRELELNKVYLNVLEENKQAIKLYKKCGFHYMVGKEQTVDIRGSIKQLKWLQIERSVYEMKGQNEDFDNNSDLL